MVAAEQGVTVHGRELGQNGDFNIGVGVAFLLASKNEGRSVLRLETGD